MEEYDSIVAVIADADVPSTRQILPVEKIIRLSSGIIDSIASIVPEANVRLNASDDARLTVFVKSSNRPILLPQISFGYVFVPPKIKRWLKNATARGYSESKSVNGILIDFVVSNVKPLSVNDASVCPFVRGIFCTK